MSENTTTTTPAQPIDPHDLEAFTQRLRDMDIEHVYEILHAVQDEVARRNEDGLPALVRAALVASDFTQEEADGARTVTFPTWPWDNGNFYNPCEGRVTFTDKHVEVVDFSNTPMDERLAELSSDAQPLGEKAGVSIDLRTGDVEHDDYLYNHL